MEIKVRVWDTYENRMVYNAQNTYDYGCTGVPIWEDSFQDVNEDTKYIKMLYIGLKDKNGKEIYEGDILVISGYSYEEPEFECCGEVKYANCGYCIEDEGEFVNISDFRGSYTTIFEVVGNVYENPELLEE